eukprot:SAG11_NODE_16275_length_552_cov_1.203091_1_plen_106_part_01
MSGVQNPAICVADPMAMERARLIFPLYAAVTAVKCSAALPTTGRRMTPTKTSDIQVPVVTASITPTRNSEFMATHSEIKLSTTTPIGKLRRALALSGMPGQTVLLV